ncbi:MAG: hypothetical protein IPK19_38925 [Chloroflexi bacterium]|nr:hypothetical protein [Chloroflexota bacterium]
MRSIFYDGSLHPEPERIPLRAGPLRLDYEAGTLRYIRAGGVEIVRGIYAAVRDHNWGTVPAELRDVRMDIRADSFTITFTSDHRQGDIHYVWQGEIVGTPEGIITFTFDGEAQTAFRRNRIGFCVLHPMDAAGKPLTVEHTDGAVEEGQFPEFIAPHQPYFDIRTLTHEAAPGLRAEVRMEGDAFEMEDQRNWTDASFKTYCTPLGLPFPVPVAAGERVRQSVTVCVSGVLPQAESGDSAPSLHLDTSAWAYCPPIGLGWSSDDGPLTDREIARLQTLRLNHLRYDLRFTTGWQERLLQVLNQARQVCPQVELAVHLSHSSADSAAEDELTQLSGFLEAHPIQGAVLIFRQGEIVTQMPTYIRAEQTLDKQILGLGTDAFFTELNRNRPDPSLETLVAYSVNPQVHAFDNASLVETIPAMGATVESAFQFVGEDTCILVTPVTLKMRWNPNATGPDAPTPPGALPPRVDPRQMSLFGAGWTMGAIASLAQAGADSLTFFETASWLGVMERESGPPLPDRFPSIPGGVFPMYHIFADIGDLFAGESGGPVLALRFTASHPLKFSGLALRSGKGLRLLVANHSQEHQTVALTGIDGAFTLKRLDKTTVEWAMRDPEGYRAVSGEAVTASGGALKLELPPYAVVRLDQTP